MSISTIQAALFNIFRDIFQFFVFRLKSIFLLNHSYYFPSGHSLVSFKVHPINRFPCQFSYCFNGSQIVHQQFYFGFSIFSCNGSLKVSVFTTVSITMNYGKVNEICHLGWSVVWNKICLSFIMPLFSWLLTSLLWHHLFWLPRWNRYVWVQVLFFLRWTRWVFFEPLTINQLVLELQCCCWECHQIISKMF